MNLHLQQATKSGTKLLLGCSRTEQQTVVILRNLTHANTAPKRSNSGHICVNSDTCSRLADTALRSLHVHVPRTQFNAVPAGHGPYFRAACARDVLGDVSAVVFVTLRNNRQIFELILRMRVQSVPGSLFPLPESLGTRLTWLQILLN